MKIKSLLILGAGNAGALENFYREGFTHYGIRVDSYFIADQYYAFLQRSTFNKIVNKTLPKFFYSKINDGLIRFLQDKFFDVILVFKGMELFPETVKMLKEHARITANYNADHPFIFFLPGSGNKNVLDGIDHYDVHFSYSKSIVSKLKSNFNQLAYCIPFGYNSHLKVALKDSASGFSNRFIFIGAYDKERAAYLDALKNPTLQIYGEYKWKTRNAYRRYIQNAYQHRSLYGMDYLEAIHSSSGVINLLRDQNLIESSHNMRTFEVPGYGGLLLSQRTQEQMEYFEEDKEAVYFDSTDELKSKMDYLLKRPEVVQSIKKSAYERSIRSGYSYDNRSKQLIDFLNDF